MPHRLRKSGRITAWTAEFRPYNRMYCESSAVYATWTAEPRRG